MACPRISEPTGSGLCTVTLVFFWLHCPRPLTSARVLIAAYRLNRIGVLVNQDNQELFRLMAGMSIFSKISAPADVIFSSLLSSEYLSTYLLISQERLRAAHQLVETWFSARGCTVHRCDAGPFLWVYMGDRLGITTWEEEARLHMRLFEEGGVYIVSIIATRPSYDSPRASLTDSRPFVFLF
jgi:hypothetical protein